MRNEEKLNNFIKSNLHKVCNISFYTNKYILHVQTRYGGKPFFNLKYPSLQYSYILRDIKSKMKMKPMKR